MNRTLVISNNPAVWSVFADSVRIKASPYEVMARVRDEVHRGAGLVGHPLAGQIHLADNPYRSVVVELSDRAVARADQVILTEETLERFRTTNFRAVGPDEERDYQLVDLSLLRSMLGQSAGEEP